MRQVEAPFLLLALLSFFLPPTMMVTLPTALFAICQLLPMALEVYPDHVQLKQAVEILRQKQPEIIAIVVCRRRFNVNGISAAWNVNRVVDELLFARVGKH
jgi:hypothetical protein